MLEILKVKTFWTGLGSIIGGVCTCFTGGGILVGVPLIVAGVSLIITGDDIQRARKVPVANGGANGATVGAAAAASDEVRPR
jgi:hypothetical protein